MSQQQLGAVALVALGILVAAGAGGAALRRRWRRQHSHEPLWSRLLVTLATVGLTVGLIATGMYYYASPLPHLLWLAQVATAGFALAVAGYGATIASTLWRKVWGD
ncbi:MAG: hypothetical protein ACXWQ5_11770 [Ktedonobacterales bacterium]